MSPRGAFLTRTGRHEELRDHRWPIRQFPEWGRVVLTATTRSSSCREEVKRKGVCWSWGNVRICQPCSWVCCRPAEEPASQGSRGTRAGLQGGSIMSAEGSGAIYKWCKMKKKVPWEASGEDSSIGAGVLPTSLPHPHSHRVWGRKQGREGTIRASGPSIWPRTSASLSPWELETHNRTQIIQQSSAIDQPQSTGF